MPGTTIGTQLSIGYPGRYSRNSAGLVITAKVVKSTDTNNINFGDPCFLNKDSTGGTLSSGLQIGASITIAAFAGFAVSNVQSNTVFNPPSTLVAYIPGQYAEVMELGNIVVNIRNVAATAIQAGGAVYVRKASGNDTVVGAIEPTSGAGGNDGGNLVLLTNVQFTTGLTSTDANGNLVAEVTILVRNTV
jgi:hypothetical protein